MTDRVNNHYILRRHLFSLGLVAATIFAAAAQAQDNTLSPELNMLVDRAAVHDLMVDYYAQLGTENHDFSNYYITDGVLEVNGLVARGRKQIIALYDRAGGMGADSPKNNVPPGNFNMMMSNLKIAVQGDTATATMLWFSIVSHTLISPPRVTEHGHDRTQLVRQNGHWLISKRVVTSDGGMPKSLLKSYLSRPDR